MNTKQAFYGAVGHLTGRAVRRSQRLGKRALPMLLFDAVLTRRISRLPRLKPAETQSITNALNDTTYWHGSGRFQYRDGTVIDLLQIVAEQGRLEPQLDHFDTTGPMQSLSLAHSRIYGRAYADIHRNKQESYSERYGSAEFWATMFLGDSGLISAKEVGGYRKALRQIRANGSHDWHRKINKKQLNLVGNFREGSDIAGNYPILYGVTKIALTKTSRAIAAHEIRTTKPIELAKHITHIEVPRERIAETKAILQAHGHSSIPVLAIEDFERFARTQPYSLLFSGTNVRRGHTKSRSL